MENVGEGRTELGLTLVPEQTHTDEGGDGALNQQRHTIISLHGHFS